MLSSEVPRSRAIEARVAALEERAVALLSGLIAAEPGRRHARPQLVARLIVQTTEALTHRWIIEPSGDPVPVERLARELMNMFDAYLASLSAAARSSAKRLPGVRTSPS